MIKLVTNNIWAEITNAAKKSKQASIVAVAFFGQKGSQMLPLLKGSTLVVDASERILKSGLTCPDELLKLYYKGVHIYSKESLHAKLFVIDNTLYCGSTNVSGNSAKYWQEAILKTDDKTEVKRAKTFIESLCGIELGPDEIMGMNKLYNPPKIFGGKKKSLKKEDTSNFHVVNLTLKGMSEEETLQLKKGRKEANKNRINYTRHRVEEFTWNKKPTFKKGDTILQIVKDKTQSQVSPIGRLIHVRKWNNGVKEKYVCFVEVPDKDSKSLSALKKALNPSDRKAIERGGKKKLDLENSIKKLWG